MFSFHPMTTSGHLNDSSGAVPRRKTVPSLAVSVFPPPPAEGSPSSSSSPSFVHNGHPNQLSQRTDGTSPADGDAMSPGTFPQLQPFFAALARNLANISPQQQQTTQQTQQRGQVSNSVSSNSNNAALSSPPFCFGHPNNFLARQQIAKQQQNSPPIGADAQQQMMTNWLNMLMMMNGNGGGGGTVQQSQNHQQKQQSEGTTAKALESDSEGNSVCPACKEPIGKEPTQWEIHLDSERSRLRDEIESLRTAVLTVQSIAISAAETTTAHPHNEQQRLGEAEVALERIRESQRQRVTAKIRGTFFTSSPIMAMLFKNEDSEKEREEERQNNRKESEGEAEEEKGGRQSDNGLTVSPFSAIELARGFKQKEQQEEEEEETKRTSPMDREGMKLISPMNREEMQRMSPMDREATKRMSPMDREATKRMSPMDREATKRMIPMDREATKRMSPIDREGKNPTDREGMKRMSPEWIKRINTAEENKRPRMEL